MILLRGGPLTSAYAAICKTDVIRPLTSTPVFSERVLTRELQRIAYQVFGIGQWFLGAMRLRIILSGIDWTSIDCAYLNSAVSCGIVAQLQKRNIPVIAHIHELQFGFIQSGHPHNLLLLLTYASRIIVPCEAVRTFLRDSHGIDAAKIVVIPEAVDDPVGRVTSAPADVRKAEHIPAEAFVVAMAGTIDWRKGIDLFIALARALSERKPHARFMWIGGGPHEAIFHQTWKQLYGIEDALAERFIFTGERTDVAPLLSTIDVFALTSREDPCPLVHIEAAMLKKPIVCFAGTGGAPEWLGSAGVVVPYQDVAAMADAISDMYNNPLRTAQMGEAGRRLMVPRACSSTVGAEVAQVIAQVAASQSKN